ncbi:unnamed protein product [Brugia pahangi]|uniref:RNase H domain-containing protein n=1 Tax=Brugia pahangi TaxID=6280 RepID=A0A0N4SYN0_BRUPA|nr:unnamed protein product [Brugia pahangi]
MSGNISIQPAKERLANLLKEINLMEIKSPESTMTLEEKYKAVTEGDQGIFQLFHGGKEAIITLTNIIELPRFVMEALQLTEFHIFTDASKVAYSAAICVLNHGYQGAYLTSFLIYAKSRIAPIKGMSVPRLELLSVLIGVRATQFILKQLNLENNQVTLWTDSICVLYWIQNYTKLFPRFVQNRIKEIRKSNFELKYVPSDQNPADIATKGLSHLNFKIANNGGKDLDAWNSRNVNGQSVNFVIQETMNCRSYCFELDKDNSNF